MDGRERPLHYTYGAGHDTGKEPSDHDRLDVGSGGSCRGETYEDEHGEEYGYPAAVHLGKGSEF